MKYPNLVDGVRMSAVALARRMIAEERVSRSVKLPEARAIIAREAGLLPGSLENLLRGRLVHIDRIAARLNGLLIAKLERKLSATQHDLAIARASRRISEADLAGVEAALDAAREVLGK